MNDEISRYAPSERAPPSYNPSDRNIPAYDSPAYWENHWIGTLPRRNGDDFASGSIVIDRGQHNNGTNVDNNTRSEHKGHAHDKPQPPSGTDYGHELIQTLKSLRFTDSPKTFLTSIQRYLSYNIDVNCADHEGRTALYWAASRGHEFIVRALVEAGGNLNASSTEYGTPLFRAIDRGEVSLVRSLLELGADVKVSRRRYGSVLHAACGMEYLISHHLEMVDLLLRAGADANALRFRNTQDKWSLAPPQQSKVPSETRYTLCTPLYIAVSRGSSALIAALLAAGAKVNDPCTVTFGPWERSYKESTAKNSGEWLSVDDCLKLLSDGGAPATAQNGRLQVQSTTYPLYWAMLSNKYRQESLICLRMLLDNGADVGKVPDALVTMALKGRTEVVELLLDYGADVDGPSGSQTPLMAAVSTNSVHTAEILLARGASVNLTRADVHFGKNALHLAKTGECVRLLARYGAELDAASMYGYTPLMSKAASKYFTAVGALLDLGASVHKVDVRGWSAYNYAKRSGATDIVEMLERRGAKPATMWTRMKAVPTWGALA